MTISEFLSHFERPTKSGDQWKVKCPAHEDRVASLGVREGSAGRVVLKCYAGCATSAVLLSMGLTESALFQTAASTRGTVATYDYKDEAGTLLYQTVRYEPKDFRQRRPDGHGGWVWNLKDTRRLLYRLNELQGREAVVIVEGEKDVNALWTLDVPATCNVNGAGKWRPDYVTQLTEARVKRVRVIPDADPPGEAHAHEVMRSCLAAGIEARLVRLPDVAEKGDVSDYLTTHSKDDLLTLLKNAPQYVRPLLIESTASVKPAAGPVLVNMATVAPEPVTWLWPGRLARGKVTIIAGDPGVGKTFIWGDVAARLTTGRPWGDGAPSPGVGHVIVLAAEDGIADTLRPRLDAMGGDPSRVEVLRAITTPDGMERAISLQTDLPHLETAVTSTRAALVVVDPISNYLGTVDSYRDTDVRQVLTPLALFAERADIAVLLVMHLTKDQKAAALYRLNSSIAFGGVARLVLVVGTDPNEANPYAPGATRVIAGIKSNLGELAEPWAYQTIDNRLVWKGKREDLRPDLLLAGAPRQDGQARQDVEAFLCEHLADGAEHRSEDVTAAAKREGISSSRLARARRDVCDSRRVGYGTDGYFTVRLKPEYRAAVPVESVHGSHDPSIHATGAKNGAESAVTPMNPITSSFFAPGANNESPANNGGDDDWGEV